MNILCFVARFWRYGVVCLLLLIPRTTRADDRFAGMDPYIREAMQKWEVPGLAIAVVKDGELVLARGYGVCEMGKHRKVTEDTVFPIASCTKSFTAACVAMLVDEGKLGWDDPVRKHLPDFRVADPYVTEHITIRDLLCHRTGLVRGDLMAMTGDFTRVEMLQRVPFLEQAAPFRGKFTYHNVMFAVLGEIIEKKSGMDWHKFVATRIFEPLGMTSTTTDYTSVPADRFAMRHRFYDTELAPLRTSLECRLVAEAGAIHSTVGDMAKWLQFQLREGEHNGQQLIAKKIVREMHSLQHSIPVQWTPNSDVYRARFAGLGFGWFVRDYRGRKLVQHGGAWGADMNLAPEENLGIVVLSNRDWNSLVWMLSYNVYDAYFVGPEQAWSAGKKWDHWLPLGGPNAGDRDLKIELKKLEELRAKDTQPSLPLEAYAGRYASKLYSDLHVTVVDGRLRVKFGTYSATLDHWEKDAFYGHAVIEPFLDWLVKFDIAEDRSVKALEFINIGWKDPDERFIFTRRAK
ncbi:MAG: serine hydrolase [Planctomycetaceae bacterium]|nr:serine hydrolase [Planctomycetaceae bacterium]